MKFPWGMLFVFSFFCLVNPLSVFPQDPDCAIRWDDPVQLSFDHVLSNTSQIAVSGGTVHIVWYGFDTLGTEASDGVQYARSTDGGSSFSPQVTISSTDTAANPAAIACSGDNVYIAFLGVIDTFVGAVLVRSTNAGATWLPPTPLKSYAIPRIVAAENERAYILFYDQIGNRDGILLSADYGESWSAIFGNTVRSNVVVNSLGIINGKLHGLFSTSSTPFDVYYYRSTDAGRNWSFFESLSKEDFTNSILPRLATNRHSELYAVWNDTGSVMMRRTRNAGFTWLPEVKLSTEDGAVFADVAAEDEFVAVAWDKNIGGRGGIDIRSSNDYGYSFCVDEPPTPGTTAGEPSLSMSGNSLHLTWTESINGDGEIMYRHGILTPNIVDVPPSQFVLHQNYPNPFNGYTHIPYEVPGPTHVSLTVYNVLGQKIREIVNADLAQGRYEARFSAYTVPSGVYFYTLRTATFSETRKLFIAR